MNNTQCDNCLSTGLAHGDTCPVCGGLPPHPAILSRLEAIKAKLEQVCAWIADGTRKEPVTMARVEDMVPVFTDEELERIRTKAAKRRIKTVLLDSDEQQIWCVYVYRWPRTGIPENNKPVQWSAYLRWQGDEFYRLVDVRAKNGPEAKRLAIKKAKQLDAESTT